MRSAGDATGPGFYHWRRDSLRPPGDGGNLPHRPRLVQDSCPLALCKSRAISLKSMRFPIPPPSEAIMDKVEELVKAGQDPRDQRYARRDGPFRPEADHRPQARCRSGEADAEAHADRPRCATAMRCNFNILIAGMPRVLGVREILEEWTAWRCECVRRRIYFQLQKKQEKLHLLQGLQKILLDIDKAIAIIRQTESEAEVVPESDDRLRHRPDPGRICCGDQAAQYQQRIYPADACTADRRVGAPRSRTWRRP